MAALAEGWVEKFSTEHQRTFYVNPATRETSWVRPPSRTRNPTPSPQALQRADSASSQQVALAAGWSEKFSQQHQRSYYQNSRTGETSWTRPAPEATNSRQRSEQTENPLHGWTELYSEQHQRTYFRNDATGETSWTRPVEATPRPATRPAEATSRTTTASDDATSHTVCVFGGGTELSDFTCTGSTAIAETFNMREWHHIETTGLPRGGCAAVSVGIRAYVFGGGRSAVDIQMYDCSAPTGDEWSRVGAIRSTRLLTCLQGIHCPAAAELDGLLYIVGGQDALGAIASVRLFVPETEQVYHLSEMRTPRAGCSCATLGDLLYVVGGRSGVCSCTAMVYSSVETYDPVDDVWGKIANMSEPRDGCAAVATAGRLYVLGGNSSNAENVPLDSVEMFNPVDGTWSYVASMSTPRYGVAAIEMPGNKILACGGWDGAQLLKSCELYDIELDRWSEMPYDMASGRMCHGICAVTGT